MKVSHNGVEWCGTFGVVLRAFLDDVLGDGEPIDAVVTYIGRNDEDTEVAVTITGITSSDILVAGSRPDIPFEMVLAVEI